MAIIKLKIIIIKTIICPVSTDRINNNTARVAVLLTSLLIMLFLMSDNIWFIVISVLDLLIQTFRKLNYSYVS
jgi:hypothetical protein